MRPGMGPSSMIAVCSADGEPLVATFRYLGKEYVCMRCGNLYGWLEPVTVTETAELAARQEELVGLFGAGKAPGTVR